MTQAGTVIGGKYKIVREIGRGGMSVVYLAVDTRLRCNWAVKEIRRRGSGKRDALVIKRLLAEADLIRRLDHPALPRIVDIIDNKETICIVMDYIAGESLDRLLARAGPQPEERVIDWAVQVCDILAYLHAQQPPIIYRDLKPANLILKPNGGISIIDFGIAREYKEQASADTSVLGTRGYAPPEQYSGQTDPRSDIYALGMTMRQLLTGIDPGSSASSESVRRQRPELSEGIEAIIRRCVEPAAEERYQSCAELRADLQEPDRAAGRRKGGLKRRRRILRTAVCIAVGAGSLGIFLPLSARHFDNREYELRISSSDPAEYYEAMNLYPGRPDAYRRLIDYYRSCGARKDDIVRLGNQLEKNVDELDLASAETAQLFYDIGKLYFSEYDGELRERAANAGRYFEIAANGAADFEKKEIAVCYDAICSFMTDRTTTSEHTAKDYEALFEKLRQTMDIVDAAEGGEANYDRISFYYVTLLLINDQSYYMSVAGFDEQAVLDLMACAYQKASDITSTLPYVIELQDKIEADYSSFVSRTEGHYNEAAKRRRGGD